MAEPYTWTMLELAMRRFGLFDTADYARGKAREGELGYPYIAYRGRQGTGDCMRFESADRVKVMQPVHPKVQMKPAKVASAPKPASVSLFEMLRK